MKRYFKFSIATLLMLCMGFGLISCIADHYIDIIAQTSCSPDLLEFVTPIVTITGDNGESQSFELSKSDFHETTEGGSITINVTINGVTTTIASTAVNNVAECPKRFDGESIKGDITVKYSVKPDFVLEKEKYVFFHEVNYRYYSMSKDGIGMSLSGTSIKPIASEVSKDEVKAYLDKLIADEHRQSFNVSTVQASK